MDMTPSEVAYITAVANWQNTFNQKIEEIKKNLEEAQAEMKKLISTYSEEPVELLPGAKIIQDLKTQYDKPL